MVNRWLIIDYFLSTKGVASHFLIVLWSPHVLLVPQALRVRRMMTEILLDVTDNEIRHVAEEVHHRAKDKQGVYI